MGKCSVTQHYRVIISSIPVQQTLLHSHKDASRRVDGYKKLNSYDSRSYISPIIMRMCIKRIEVRLTGSRSYCIINFRIQQCDIQKRLVAMKTGCIGYSVIRSPITCQS